MKILNASLVEIQVAISALRPCALEGDIAPVITVSWKGAHWGWGAEDGIRDAACFAVPSAAHISSHIDRNGLSLSVTSKQPAAMREDLLRRIIARLGCGTVERILSFEGHSCRPIRCACATDARLSETLGNS